METTIRADEIQKLLKEGQEYSPQELHDLVSQLQKEKELPDAGDFIIFHNRTYKVKKATYAVIRKTIMNPMFTRTNALMASLMDDKWYYKIPFVTRIIEWHNHKKSLKNWDDLIRITFDGYLKEMELENLTPAEVTRLKRIFFRWQAEDSQENPERSKPTS